MANRDEEPVSGINPERDKFMHARVAEYVLFRLNKPSVGFGRALNLAYLRQTQRPDNVMSTLYEVGDIIEPADVVLGVDEKRPAHRAFLAGATVALESLDTLCYETRVEKDTFRDFWMNQTSFVLLPDPTEDEELTSEQMYAIIGMGVIDKGAEKLEALERPYQELIERIDDMNVTSPAHSNVLKGAFGFVFGAGREALSAYRWKEFEKQVAIPHEWDDELKKLLKQAGE